MQVFEGVGERDHLWGHGSLSLSRRDVDEELRVEKIVSEEGANS